MIAGKRYYGENTSGSVEAKTFQALVADMAKLSGESHLADFLPMVQRVASGETVKRFMNVYTRRDAIAQKWIDELRHTGTYDSVGRMEKSMIEILMSLKETEYGYFSDDDIKSLLLVRCLFIGMNERNLTSNS